MKISTITIFSLLGTLCRLSKASSSASGLRVQRNMQEVEECRPRLWRENSPAIPGPDLSQFGGQVDISADGLTMAVTAEAAIEPTSGDKTGSLSVYRKNTLINEWVQLGDTIYGTVDNGKFGKSLAMGSNGKLVAVGATGSVSVFFFEGGSNFTLVGGQALTSELPGFGSAVDVSSGSRLLAVGNGQENTVNIFSIKAFDKNPTALNLIQAIQGAPTAMFGSALSISDDGNTLAVGAPGTECNVNIGKVVVYTRPQQPPAAPDDQFTEFQTLKATDSDEFGDSFGGSVDVTSDGKIIAVGDVGAGEFGAVTVYNLFRGEYTQTGQKLKGDSAFPSFGNIVAINVRGNVLVVASPDAGAGVVRVYRLVDRKTWIRVGQELSGEMEGDQFGSAVSISSNGLMMAIGIEGEDSVMSLKF